MLKLNDEQKQAVEHKDGALGVIAGAGSGKSLVLLERIRNLVKVHKVKQEEILAITFTDNTATELTEKLANMGLKRVNVGTFHSICLRQLNRANGGSKKFRMIKDFQVENLFKEIDRRVDVQEVRSFIGYQKNNGISPDDQFILRSKTYSEDEFRKFYKAYENFKKKNSLYDFDDFLILGLENVRKHGDRFKFDYVLVDEHQDSNKVQNELLKAWTRDNNIFAVFDFRQSIYGFRGSSVEYSMNFDSYWNQAKVINMFTNYRSTRNIVERSNEFIKHYYGNYKHYKDAKAFNQKDGIIEVHSSDKRVIEAMKVVNQISELIKQGTEPKEIAVLYRNNVHADYVENELKIRGIDYYISNDASFFKRREVAGILSILRLILNTNDDSAFETVFRTRLQPLMYFSNNLLVRIKDYAYDKDISYFEALPDVSYDKFWQRKNAIEFVGIIQDLQNAYYSNPNDLKSLIDQIVVKFKLKSNIEDRYTSEEEREERLASIQLLKRFTGNHSLEDFIDHAYSDHGDKKKKANDNVVQLMTVHRSKGLEWDNVFVIGVQDGEFPSKRPNAINDIEEEARLFYVAVTRSKKNLWIHEIGRNNKFIVEYVGDSDIEY